MRYDPTMLARSTSAGALLREARTRAGLTQSELARRAGVAQSVISAYEANRRQPALSTLARLIQAAGYDLDVDLRRSRGGLARLTGPTGRKVRRCRAAMVRAAAAYGVSQLRLFGSVARGEDDVDSDVDLLVDVPPGLGLLTLARLQRDLEEILQTRVDVVPAGDLKPDVRTNVAPDLIAL
jgi:hypothetical protein